MGESKERQASGSKKYRQEGVEKQKGLIKKTGKGKKRDKRGWKKAGKRRGVHTGKGA
jgi:hypothetical protein